MGFGLIAAKMSQNTPPKSRLIALLGCRFFWSADILVRFGVDLTGEADKNVRPPIALGPPSEKYQMRTWQWHRQWKLEISPSSFPRDPQVLSAMDLPVCDEGMPSCVNIEK